jgi:hypothetical protein
MRATSKDIPWAVAEGEITIGEGASALRIPCAVLEDGTRVLWQQGFLRAIGRKGRAAARAITDAEGLQLPVFLRASNLKPFITRDLLEASKAITFRPIISSRGGISYGYKADLLPQVCNTFLEAADAGVLKDNQRHIYERCRILIRAFAVVGITALIDEATGYQTQRAHDELQKLLTAYVLPEHRPWVKTIPREFTTELYRVWGWDCSSQQGPRYAGKLTRKLLYETLPTPVLPELDRVNPANPVTWRRKRKHFQHLTEKIGIEHFKGQLAGVMALLRASPNKRVFMSLFERAYGKQKRFEFAEVEVDDFE